MLLLSFVAACSSERKATPAAEAIAGDSVAAAAAAPSLARHVGTVTGLQTPESARWDAETGVWFISNIKRSAQSAPSWTCSDRDNANSEAEQHGGQFVGAGESAKSLDSHAHLRANRPLPADCQTDREPRLRGYERCGSGPRSKCQAEFRPQIGAVAPAEAYLDPCQCVDCGECLTPQRVLRLERLDDKSRGQIGPCREGNAELPNQQRTDIGGRFACD